MKVQIARDFNIIINYLNMTCNVYIKYSFSNFRTKLASIKENILWNLSLICYNYQFLKKSLNQNKILKYGCGT